MNAALYVRTSTADQDGQAQLHALRRAATARGWGTAPEFIDVGFSGVKTSRPALDKMKKEIRSGKINVVMIAALDRLGRSLRDLLVLIDDFSAAGCVIVSIRENLDLTTPSGRLMLQVLGALAEFERTLIVDRVKAGIARAQATGRTRSGRPIGRPRRLVDVAAVQRLLDEGKPWREIAQTLRVPRRTLMRTFEAERKPHAA